MTKRLDYEKAAREHKVRTHGSEFIGDELPRTGSWQDRARQEGSRQPSKAEPVRSKREIKLQGQLDELQHMIDITKTTRWANRSIADPEYKVRFLVDIRNLYFKLAGPPLKPLWVETSPVLIRAAKLLGVVRTRATAPTSAKPQRAAVTAAKSQARHTIYEARALAKANGIDRREALAIVKRDRSK